MPLVTVIVPAYNVAPWLPQCLESIAAQEYEHLEVIVVDDGSTDSTGDIARRMAARDSRFTVVSKPNGGLSSARNAALDVATGEWVMMVDGDDLVPPRAVSDLIAASRSGGAVDVAAGAWELFNDGEAPLFLSSGTTGRAWPWPGRERRHDLFLSADEAIKAIYYQDGRLTGSACARLLRRTLFDGLRFPEGKLYEDLAIAYDLYSRCTRGVAVTTAVVYGYRQRRAGSILNRFTPARADVLDHLDHLHRRLDTPPVGPGLGLAANSREIIPAINARRLAAALNLLTLAPAGNEYAALRARCFDTIKQVRRQCIANPYVRTRDRLAAVASYCGPTLLRLLARLSRLL
ncbi:MAG: glycosyltransferase family 2 protein [Muribaculaceae bacterium]|nr:glycosyltransferase family 2 protein [Muribaculaceae bacterium]